ncbi:hypothetical protein ACOMHN_031937 [Nucella lapillus]
MFVNAEQQSAAGGTDGQPPPPPASSSRSEKAWLVAKWHDFDIRFMKPLLTNSRPTLIDTMPKCCLPFAKLFTTEEQLSQGRGMAGDRDSDTDMILDDQQLSMGGHSDLASLEQVSVANHQTGHTEGMQMEEGGQGDLGVGGEDPLPWRIGLHGSDGDHV